MAQNAMSDESRPVTASLDEKARSSLAAGPAQRWWILGVVGLAQLMVVLDATIVNIALPSAQRDLGFSNADRQWVVTAYSLAFGGLPVLGGLEADLLAMRTRWMRPGGSRGSCRPGCTSRRRPARGVSQRQTVSVSPIVGGFQRGSP